MGRNHPAVDPSNPEAWGVCDRCTKVRPFRELQKQMEYSGDSLTWIGLLVCPEHLDRPQPQNRTRHLFPDPVPINNPRADQAAPALISSWVLIKALNGTSTVKLKSAVGFVSGDSVQISLDNQRLFTTTATLSGFTLTLAAPLTFQASAGNMVIDLTRSG